LAACNPCLSLKATAMSETLPDRLSADPASPYHDAALLERGVGVRFKGQEKNNVEEYCVTRDRKGRPLTVKLKGAVEPYFRAPVSDS
jgi:hypothetical protein